MIKITKKIVGKCILALIALLLIIIAFKVCIAQFYYSEKNYKPVVSNEEFRMALSVSPFTQTAFENGYSYEYNGKQINSTKELEQTYIDNGATEMYVRIATKRHRTEKDETDGIIDTNANVHTFDQAIEDRKSTR